MSVQSFLLTIHLNRESNLVSKTLTTPKLKELEGPKVRLKQLVLGATIPPNLMRFRCTVMEKCRRNISQHTYLCDDLYHPCAFTWGQSQSLTTSKPYSGMALLQLIVAKLTPLSPPLSPTLLPPPHNHAGSCGGHVHCPGQPAHRPARACRRLPHCQAAAEQEEFHLTLITLGTTETRLTLLLLNL